MHLSLMPQVTRYGLLGKVNWAVVDASDVTAGGGIVLTSGVGTAPTFCHQADRILIELNRRHPPTLLGFHDCYLTIVEGGYTPHTLSAAFRMHEQFQRTGDMRGVCWEERTLVDA